MIELLKKYKVLLVCCLVVLFHISWNFLHADKAQAINIQSNYETYEPEPIQEIATQTPLSQEIAIEQMPQVAISTQVPVYICGEITYPGVYYVMSNAIIYDVIELSGGFTSQADHNYLNLASQIIPHQKIYIPKVGEEIDKYANSYHNEEVKEIVSVPSFSSSKININTATEKELQTLNGIGEVKARSIVEYRMRIGKFNTIEELLLVSGIGDKTLEKIRTFITV